MKFLRAAALLAILLAPAAAPAQDTLSITGTFKMNDLYPTVGADLEGVFANGNNHWWRLTLSGVTYSHEYDYSPYENGGYIEQWFTRLNAASFTLEFFGPDAAILNQVVASQLSGGSLPGGAVLELMNANYYDPDFPYESGPYAYWSLGLAPPDPAVGVSLGAYPWGWLWGRFAADEQGFPLVQPQRLYPDQSQIGDGRNGNNGALVSYYDLVDLGSDQEPVPPPPPHQVDIQDASVLEGDKGTTILRMTVTLNRTSEQLVSVSYKTANGAAAAPKDYAAASGTLTFQPGETTKTISISVKGDRQREPNETFTVRLSNNVGADLGRSIGTGTILNDD